MKKILVLIDGVGDLPNEKLGGKTPLELANMPNLNEFAKKSRLGFMFPVNEDYAPESDTAIVSILGNDFDISERGVFEAIGAGIKIRHGDLVLRANFGTVEDLKSRKIIDRRAGRTLTTDEAKLLADAINKNVKLPAKFEFFPTIQHRGILVIYGGFSDNITNTDTYQHERGKIWVKEKFDWAQSLEDDETSEFAANIVNSFVDQSFKILDNHPINQKRRKKGILPANVILTRDAGVDVPDLIKFRNAMAVVSMPLEKGIAKVSSMDVYNVDYPDMKTYDVYDYLSRWIGLTADEAIKMLKKHDERYDFAYIHFKETDVPGHDNKPIEKKNILEILDKRFFKFLKDYAVKEKAKVIITGDHSTPCKFKTHTSDAVPLLFFDPAVSIGDNLDFNEKNCLRGSLGKVYGKALMKKTKFV